jgi:RNA polymerase sigma factor (sigma-70 family)
MALELLEAIDILPDDERRVVELKFIDGCTEAEAGQILGVHEDTVKRRWARARVKLAKKLAVFGPEN